MTEWRNKPTIEREEITKIILSCTPFDLIDKVRAELSKIKGTSFTNNNQRKVYSLIMRLLPEEAIKELIEELQSTEELSEARLAGMLSYLLSQSKVDLKDKNAAKLESLGERIMDNHTYTVNLTNRVIEESRKQNNGPTEYDILRGMLERMDIQLECETINLRISSEFDHPLGFSVLFEFDPDDRMRLRDILVAFDDETLDKDKERDGAYQYMPEDVKEAYLYYAQWRDHQMYREQFPYKKKEEDK